MDTPEYIAWEATVPASLKRDLLWKLPAYRFGACVAHYSFSDANRLLAHPLGRRMAEQLFSAASSVPANIAEGYAKRSGTDRARHYEYALGSAREAREHYRAAAGVLGVTATSRVEMLSRVVAVLVAAIPKERARKY